MIFTVITVGSAESIKEADKFKPLSQAQVNSGIYYSEYLEIKRRADAGDKEAKKMLMPP